MNTQVAAKLVHSVGGEINRLIVVVYPWPITYNNEALNDATRKKAEEFIGKDNVEETNYGWVRKILAIILS